MFGIPVGFIDLSEQTARERALPCKVCAHISEAQLYLDCLSDWDTTFVATQYVSQNDADITSN